MADASAPPMHVEHAVLAGGDAANKMDARGMGGGGVRDPRMCGGPPNVWGMHAQFACAVAERGRRRCGPLWQRW